MLYDLIYVKCPLQINPPKQKADQCLLEVMGGVNEG